MDVLFIADSPQAALADNAAQDGVALPGIMPTPHFEQLAQIALGREVPMVTAGFIPLTEFHDPDQAAQAGANIQQLPEALRDMLAEVEVDETIAARWADELWGVDPAQALVTGSAVAALAREAKAAGRQLYWTFTY